jgi:hypothetical protein
MVVTSLRSLARGALQVLLAAPSSSPRVRESMRVVAEVVLWYCPPGLAQVAPEDTLTFTSVTAAPQPVGASALSPVSPLVKA